jgi:DNA-binding transcriptional LysR family regulator
MLDLNLLRVLDAVLTYQNVTVAARHVGLSQSALSNALARLRTYFGDPLFVKTGKGMLPTARALHAGNGVRQALALIRASTEKSKDVDVQSSRRTIRFCMSDVGEATLLPPLMKRLRQLDAKVRIETYQLPTEVIAERLATGDIDFASGYFPAFPPGVQRFRLFREHYVCMTSRDYQLGPQGRLTLKDYIAAPHVLIDSLGSGHRAIERAFERRDIQPNAVLRVPHFIVIPLIVASTDLIVTIPSRAASAFAGIVPVRVHPLPLKIPSFDCVLAWHQRFAEDPLIRWMRSLIRELFPERAGPLAVQA